MITNIALFCIHISNEYLINDRIAIIALVYPARYRLIDRSSFRALVRLILLEISIKILSKIFEEFAEEKVSYRLKNLNFLKLLHHEKYVLSSFKPLQVVIIREAATLLVETLKCATARCGTF